MKRRLRSGASRTSEPSTYRPRQNESAGSSDGNTGKRRQKRSAARCRALVEQYERCFHDGTDLPSCHPRARQHALAYHKPLLLSEQAGARTRKALLDWFQSVRARREMPWRKGWVDPKLDHRQANQREALERRAYEVWISEVMLQQTRVAVVIDYWNRWMARWPSIHLLAAARPEEVLSAWRGLGYYSRATRIHQAAQLVVGDPVMRGLLPSSAAELQAKVPGIGRYTAGAISAIVFGEAQAMVDGNVLRVLSRQLGIHGNVKTDKAVTDVIWVAAAALASAVAADDGPRHGEAPPPTPVVNERPGLWGQALMELGSTVCTPTPICRSCPITVTCRAHLEGQAMAQRQVTNMPPTTIDACTLCEPLEIEDSSSETLEGVDERRHAKAGIVQTRKEEQMRSDGGRQLSLDSFLFECGNRCDEARQRKAVHSDGGLVTDYVRRFPLKTVKGRRRQEDNIVCVIRRHDDRYYIQRRPSKGLLAGMWEFPSYKVSLSTKASLQSLAQLAHSFALDLFSGENEVENVELEHLGSLGSIPWTFTHLDLTMHVHLFSLKGAGQSQIAESESGRWSEDIEAESMGTGMLKCWTLVKAAAAAH